MVPRQRAGRASGRAFTLIELLVVIAIIALLISILLPTLDEARESGRKMVCNSNKKQMIVAALNYSTDERDRIPAFTWASGVNYGPGTSTPVGDHTSAAAAQAIDILRRRGGRIDMTPPALWIPNVLYTHLVLNDYLAQRLPEPAMACPNDRKRILWQNTVRGKTPAQAAAAFQALGPADRPPGTGTAIQRWPYSSSYQFVPASWAPDQRKGTINTVEQAGTHATWLTPPAGSGGKQFYGLRKITEVDFASSKVYVHDQYDRHSTKRRQLFFMYPEARESLLFFDGSVRDYKTSQGNRGFQPNNPLSAAAEPLNYDPDPWESPNRFGTYTPDPVVGQYRFTRAGLRGVDFNGSEVAAKAP